MEYIILEKKHLSKLFPEIVDSIVSVDDILQKGEQLHENDKDNRALQNLLSGKTKRGVYGEEFYVINKSLVDLPILC